MVAEDAAEFAEAWLAFLLASVVAIELLIAEAFVEADAAEAAACSALASAFLTLASIAFDCVFVTPVEL
jgi:hypothetical protein